MIDIKLKSDFFSYDAFHIVKAFFPQEDIRRNVLAEQIALARLIFPDGKEVTINCAYEQNELKSKDIKHYVNKKIYNEMKKHTGMDLEWGFLTGIRPTKIAMRQLEQGVSKQEVIRWLQEYYCVSERKAELGVEIAEREQKLLQELDYQKGFSLYVGIPFCPTTCFYCSFTSYPINSYKQRVDAYLDALCKEITFVGSVSKDKKLDTIYIGGGTPTTLEPAQLERLLTHLEHTFSFQGLKELTVEAGRPDSITKEKLMVLRKHNISRISINPQTMQQTTLDTIGRKHTVEDVKRVYKWARELKFSNINMDLIVGLQGEDLRDVEDTLQQIEELKPDSLTIHSLAVKRAARMRQEDVKTTPEEMEKMTELGANYAKKMGLLPYYLYRQKNIAGNFENVGYAKVDKAGIYNILIMEEKQSIVAVGAGASTKIVLPREKDNIVRIENVKDIEMYISRIDEMIERKGEWLWH